MIVILIGALIGYYLSIGILYPIEIDTPNAIIDKEEYLGNLEAIENDGYVNPVIYSITKKQT